MKYSKAEVEAVIAASPRSFVPLNKLILSADHQARTPGSTPKLSIPELAASIKESGVLQNLIVVEGARGRCEVCAGGRRLEALTLLVANGDIADNYPVPVLVVPADRALIASLSENCFHVPMHAADEYEAFAKLIAQGRSMEDVAAAFGVTPLVVKRRMKLATVSPTLMAKFREGEIGLDCLMVLASFDDHHRQEQAWAGLPQWNRRPDHLRQLLAQGEIDAHRDPVAKFVTLKAYEKAGGAVRRDLFSDDEKTAYLQDTALLERLATEKLQKRVKAVLAEGWKWVDVRVRYAYDEYVKHGELRKARREPNSHEAAELAALESRIETLHTQMQAIEDAEGDEEAFLHLESEVDGLESRRSALHEGLAVWPPELMSQAGCVLFVGTDGAASVKRGLVRPEDREQMAQAAREAGQGQEQGAADALLSQPAAQTRPLHSERLVRRLTAHRVAAVQAELLNRPQVAIAALTAQLAQKAFHDNLSGYRRFDPVFDISVTSSHGELCNAAEDMKASRAWATLEQERQAWRAMLPEDLDACLPWLLSKPPGVVLKLLTFVVAISVKGIYAKEPERQCNEAVAQALNLDMTAWWTVSGDSYLDHVSKNRVVEVVADAVDANAASPLASLKKPDAVACAEQSLAGKGWLPPVLRVGAPGSDVSRRSATDSSGVGADERPAEEGCLQSQ